MGFSGGAGGGYDPDLTPTTEIERLRIDGEEKLREIERLTKERDEAVADWKALDARLPSIEEWEQKEVERERLTRENKLQWENIQQLLAENERLRGGK